MKVRLIFSFFAIFIATAFTANAQSAEAGEGVEMFAELGTDTLGEEQQVKDSKKSKKEKKSKKDTSILEFDTEAEL